jgi:hypothetical protein
MKSYPTLRPNLLILLILLTTSCVQTGVRIPPGTNEADLATIYFYSEKGMDTSYLAVDGIGQGMFDTGLNVLPGEHEATTDYTIEDESCYWTDYCYDTTYYGSCHATVRAEAGHEYAVRLSHASSSAYISVEDAKTGETAGAGSCELKRSAPSSTSGKIKLH